MRVVPAFATAAAASLLLAGAAADLAGQVVPARNFYQGMRTGIGYTATPPNVLAGVGAWHFFGTGRAGGFIDAKLTLPSGTRDARHCPAVPDLVECSITWVHANRPRDEYMRERREYLLLNGGVVYALTSEFAVMLGAGAARRQIIHEFYDNPENNYPPLTEKGIYSVDSDPAQEWMVQGVAGLLIRAGGNVAFRFGFESAPGSLSLGVYLVLP